MLQKHENANTPRRVDHIVGGEKRCCGGSETDEQKRPPATRAEVIFRLDDNWMEHSYHKECGYAYDKSCKVHSDVSYKSI